MLLDKVYTFSEKVYVFRKSKYLSDKVYIFSEKYTGNRRNDQFRKSDLYKFLHDLFLRFIVGGIWVSVEYILYIIFPLSYFFFWTYKSFTHNLLGGGSFGHSILTFNNYLISQLYIIQNWGGRGSGGVSWWWCGVGGVGEFLLFNPKIIWFSENVTFFRNFEICPKFVNIFPKKKIGKTFCCKLLPLM